MNLPAALLGAIADQNGGRVVLVIGAGCSFEPPTNLPLARACAEEAHRKLLLDGVIGPSECANPSDLSSVADAVKAAHSGQKPLVDRLPVGDFRSAEPNEGHRLAAALMRESAIRAVVTLNFDLAISAALANLGSKEVTILNGPQDHHLLAATNLVYLHRNAYAAAEDWILSTDALENAWQGQWEECIAAAMLSAPVTVFVGLGSPAAVLLESTRKIRAAIPDGVDAFQVDPGDVQDSEFFRALGLPEENYIRGGWVNFMRELSARLTAEQRNALYQASIHIRASEGLQSENIDSLLDQLEALGLVTSGRVRARWMLEPTGYLPHRGLNPEYVANLVLAIALIERVENCSARIASNGDVVLARGRTSLGRIRVAAARGLLGWLALEAKLHQAEVGSTSAESPSLTVVSGVGPPPSDISPPADITSDTPDDSIVSPQRRLKILTVEELRSDPARARGAFV